MDDAKAIFEEARIYFESHGSKDPKKKARFTALLQTSHTDDIYSLLDEVKNAQHNYIHKKSESTLWSRLEQLSERIHYYGSIMDVLVQQHPEYVSLAWGAMKLLVGAVVEHKKIGVTITNGLIDVADALSREKLAISLYPTPAIKQIFVRLYVHIIRFLLRALEWYEEGPWRRAIHSITKPVSLQYNDIINDIHRATTSISANLAANSQAELREVHNKLLKTEKMIESIRVSGSTDQEKILQKLQDLYSLLAATRSEQAEISRSVSTIQSTQALHVISTQCLIDHQTSLHRATSLRDQRRLTQKARTTCFWKTPSLQEWNQSSVSSILPVKVPCTDRQVAQDFCINIIEQLHTSHVANLWVLTPQLDCHPVIATLKSLIYQAATITNERGAKSNILKYLDQFNYAKLQSQFLDVLIGLLSSFKVVYIIVQLEAIDPLYAKDFFLCLKSLIEKLRHRGSSAVIRTLILSWSPKSVLSSIEETQYLSLQRRGRLRRKGTQIPRKPLFTR
ncbi:hypothetical protein N7540_011793 [Penicillium herquei]|nr:hypothetical protein N7540_011793 [Penicillium herquei]